MKPLNCGSHGLVSSKTRAFTMVELLVVMLIVAVLAVVLLSSFSTMGNLRKRVVCLQNTRTVLQASLNYSNEDNGGFPILEFEEDNKGNMVQKGLTLSNMLHDSGHLKERTIMCPLAGKDHKKDPGKLGFKYAINVGLIRNFPKIRQVPAPHSKVSLISEFYNDTSWHLVSHLNNTMNKGIDLGTKDVDRNAQYHGSKERRGLHMGFLDGHCELLRPDNNDWQNAKFRGDEKNPAGYFYEQGIFNKMREGTFVP